ncbi:lanthionine synthetase C family protein [Aquimarina sp. M1]
MDQKKRLENKLEEIADFLLYHKDDNKEIGALSGISGNAMFHFYYANYKDDDRHREKGAEIISEAFNRIEKGYTYPTFCNGIAGACWVLELLKEEKFIELEEDIITEDVDKYLFGKMKAFIMDNNFDFMHGAIGIGLYYFKRFQNVTSSDLKNRYEMYLMVLINAISETVIVEDDTVRWKSKIVSGEYIAEGYNLGLAHGIPSIINFLSRLVINPSFSDKIKNLLKPACNYILNCKHKNTELTSSFPNWVIEGRFDSSNSRLAWCYGDLGIGLSILKSGQSLKDIFLINEAIEVLIKTTLRKDIEETRILDAGLCHGAYGVLNLYNQIYNQTKNLIFKNSIEYWANVSLDLATHKDGYAGYKELDDYSWKSNQKFLGGISGIGLAIINYIENHYSKWNEALLIS